MGLWTQFTGNGNIWKGKFGTWRETNEIHLDAIYVMFARDQYRKQEIWKENHLQAIYIWDKKDSM